MAIAASSHLNLKAVQLGQGMACPPSSFRPRISMHILLLHLPLLSWPGFLCVLPILSSCAHHTPAVSSLLSRDSRSAVTQQGPGPRTGVAGPHSFSSCLPPRLHPAEWEVVFLPYFLVLPGLQAAFPQDGFISQQEDLNPHCGPSKITHACDPGQGCGSSVLSS